MRILLFVLLVTSLAAVAVTGLDGQEAGRAPGDTQGQVDSGDPFIADWSMPIPPAQFVTDAVRDSITAMFLVPRTSERWRRTDSLDLPLPVPPPMSEGDKHFFIVLGVVLAVGIIAVIVTVVRNPLG